MSKWILLLAFLSSLTASGQDSLVRFKDLRFNSDDEKEQFSNYVGGKPVDPFVLMMSVGKSQNGALLATGVKRFEEHFPTLEGLTQKQKKNDKRIKSIYDDVHKTFLQKYEEVNRFQEIFVNGRYNCVSATALYGFYFERLGIPYVIKEIPSHVFLVAYPDAEQIRVETTSPANGIATMNDAFKQNFVKMLRDQKLITALEYGSQGVDMIFDKFYFKENKNITLTELAGIQYINDALFLSEDENYEAAFPQIQKGYLLFPGERTGFVMTSIAQSAFHTHKDKDRYHAWLLGQLSRFTSYGVEGDQIRGEFSRVMQELLFTKGLKTELEEYYEELSRNIVDTTLRKDLAFVYNIEYGRYYYNQSRLREALPYWEKALSLHPEDVDVASNFISLVARMSGTEGNMLNVITDLEKYAALYPVLKENNNFNLMLATAYGIQCGNAFGMNKSQEGEKYRQLFEDILQRYPDLDIQSIVVSEVYGKAAVYYFRKGQTTKARSLLDKGLSYSPGNQELLIRKEMIR